MLKEFKLEELAEIVDKEYGIKGELKQLEGYTDNNYLIKSNQGKYILKISSYH